MNAARKWKLVLSQINLELLLEYECRGMENQSVSYGTSVTYQ